MTNDNNYIENYLNSVKRQFRYYKDLADKSIDQISDEDFFNEVADESNSVAIIAKHLAGNMLSRWTDFWTSDGEKEWRNRDTEFELGDLNTRDAILEYWERGWSVLFDAINSIDEDNFGNMVYIRNMGHTIPDAVNRQLCHYSYHIGQMVYVAKLLKGSSWNSLSIPKGKSAEYNAGKFAKPKRKEHFTDDL
jgi:hypothetical protein